MQPDNASAVTTAMIGRKDARTQTIPESQTILKRGTA
jgi:hypothetical protein